MKNRVAIFTWCYFGKINYGQILQCYATQKLCEEYGFDVTIINYRPLKEFENIYNIPPKGIERDKYERQYKERYIERQDEKQVERFLEFIDQNIHLSSRCYSVCDIEEEIEDKDFLIVGSDQLWNPIWFDPVYLLEFAKKGQKCISIATGGISVNRKIYHPTFERIAKRIGSFEFVSVREAISKNILNTYTNKKIIDILDPTLLLDEVKWMRFCDNKLIDDEYIFVYYLGQLTPHKHILKEIAKKYNLKRIIYIKMHDSKEKINDEGIMEAVIDAGPKELLSLIRYSNVVCTDSFHGFVFSLIFEKEFFLMDRAYTSRDKVSDTREKNIIDSLKIGKRYANCKKDLIEIEAIDYAYIKKNLYEKRKYCRNEIEQVLLQRKKHL